FACDEKELEHVLRMHGEVPLPPYILRSPGPSAEEDRARYQTIYAAASGAVAAPTAGLHFSERLFSELEKRAVQRAFITLHVGPGTFRPVKSDDLDSHFMDPEPFVIPPETASLIERARNEKRRIIAVGTTTLRALEGGYA